jgi:branched-chain amino acid transport system substrate-binding protein
VRPFVARGTTPRRPSARRHLRPGTRIVAAIALVIAAAGCGLTSSSSGSGDSSGPITIGVSVSLSGGFSADGLATKEGYQIWAAYQNEHGGILGRKVQLEFLSDGSSQTQVVTNYQKLININHVDFTLGPYSTLLTAPAAAAANRYGYAMIEAIGDGPLVFSQGLHNVFDVSASSKYQLITFAKWLVDNAKPQPVAYASMEDPFLQPELEGTRDYLTQHGFPSAVYKTYPASATDWSPIASAIANSGAQIVVLGSMPPDGYGFIQDFIQDRYDPKILIEATGPDQGTQFIKAVGANNTEGIMVPNTWFPGSTYFQNTEMVNLYLSLFGGTPSDISADVAEAFSTGQVLTEAVDHLKTMSNSRLEAYLHSGVTFQTVQGPAKFMTDGENAVATPYIFQWQKGVLVDVLPAGISHSVPIEPTKAPWGSAP